MRPSTPGVLLRRASTEAFLATDPVNLRYLTGVPVSSGAMLVLPRRFLLFVDERYREEAQREARAGVTVRSLDELAACMKQVRSCGYEADNVSVERFLRWQRKYPRTKFVRITRLVDRFRRRKDPDELRWMRRADRITWELLRRIPGALRRSVTEREVARRLTIWALELGAEGMSFDPIVAFGPHTSSPHHYPTSRPLRKGDLVQIDCGVKVQGYCSDASEVYFTAQPTPEQSHANRAVREAQRRAIAALRPGASTRALDELARSILRKAGIEDAFCHALGHGVGLEIHEGVSLSQRAPDERLLQSEVVTVEPGVYFPGKWGMRVEKMVVVA